MSPVTNPIPEPWWHDAVNVFSEVTGVMVVPILAGLFIGRALDKHYGTEPLFVLILTALGILLAALFMTRIARRYIARVEAEDKAKKNHE